MPTRAKDIKLRLNLYDKKHLANLVLRAKYIESLFDEAANEAARIGGSTGFDNPENPFYFSDFPAAKQQIDKVIAQLHSDLFLAIEEGDRQEWLLACEKNDKMVDMLVGLTSLPKERISSWKQPNLNALEAFQSRKIDGLNLSDKVWKIAGEFKGELELALDIGLGEGKSAADLSQDVRRLLKEPNKLFRRVRDKHGNLRLSKNAKAYNPGQGVYRSSAKNALRLTATENNIAYRTSDFDRWQQIDFVIGIEINLSNNHTLNGHPFYDICDELKGLYPKDFKFTGWHPFCRCFAVPKLADMKQFLEYQQRLLAGEDVSGFEFAGTVKDVPDNFKGWIEKNEARITKAGDKGGLPYFLKDNSAYYQPSYKSVFTQKKYKQDFIDYAGNNERENIAKGGLVNSYKMYYESAGRVSKYDLELLMENYFGEHPDNVNGKFGGVKVVEGKNYVMECVRDNKRYNYFHINNRAFNANGIKFNAHDELLNAIQMIREGKTLTFKEEYAIENKWHEILHAKSVGLGGKRLSATQTTAMEAVNQFVARRTYPGIPDSYRNWGARRCIRKGL
jgi:hypothetical protein